MAKPGLLLVSIDPSSRWDDVYNSSSLALNAIPSAVSKLVLQAKDDPDPEKPYRHQIMFPLQNVSAISIPETVQKLSGLSAADVDFVLEVWNLELDNTSQISTILSYICVLARKLETLTLILPGMKSIDRHLQLNCHRE